jgi:hypothetical protein
MSASWLHIASLVAKELMGFALVPTALLLPFGSTRPYAWWGVVVTSVCFVLAMIGSFVFGLARITVIGRIAVEEGADPEEAARRAMADEWKVASDAVRRLTALVRHLAER